MFDFKIGICHGFHDSQDGGFKFSTVHLRSESSLGRGKVMTFGERMSEECGFSTAFNRNERPVAA